MAAGLTRTVLQMKLEQKLNSQSDLTGRSAQETEMSPSRRFKDLHINATTNNLL